jgi:DNA-binding response OmpR family regulator
MSERGNKVFVVDTNLFFVKRLTEALKQKNFEAIHCSDAAYALTMIEWNMPEAILCSINQRGANSFEIPTILRSDAKTSHIPVIAIGDRGQQSQLEALRAGYEDFVDRRLGAEEIVAHLASLLASHQDGFQPTQMLTRSETALDGRLSMVDLPGVIQMIEQSRQTGALHVNASSTDGIIFFDSGEVIHAESGLFAGDDAIVCLIKKCHNNQDGVYKFMPGSAPTLRTVHCNLSGLIMDALRELDEQERDATLERDAEVGQEQVEPTPEPESIVTPALEEPVPDSHDSSANVLTDAEHAAPEASNDVPVIPEAFDSTPSFANVFTEEEPTDETEIVNAAPVTADAFNSEPIDFGSRALSDRLEIPDVEEESPRASFNVFDSAAVDDALSALDGQLSDLLVNKEETHE